LKEEEKDDAWGGKGRRRRKSVAVQSFTDLERFARICLDSEKHGRLGFKSLARRSVYTYKQPSFFANRRSRQNIDPFV
jgi:hypothetical protein